MTPYKAVLTIAGSDSSGGAGIQADIKTISAIGCYAASVITSLTAQNTLGVQKVEKISADFIYQQLESVLTDIHFDAIKIGMIQHAENAAVIISCIQKFHPKNIVIDPVMVSKNGCLLMDADAVPVLTSTLFPCAILVTPNIPEAEKLLNKKIDSLEDMKMAAFDLSNIAKTSILLKGGHLKDVDSPDVLYLFSEKKFYFFNTKRIDTKNTHGTGCTYSSAIAAYLAHGYSLVEAVSAAKNYIFQAILSGSKRLLGRGYGPVHHFYERNNRACAGMTRTLEVEPNDI